MLISSQSHITISVIVPVYRGGENFIKCLNSLFNADPSADEIIVVSDGESLNAPINSDFGVKIIETELRGGPATARNIGAKAAKGDVLLFIDADVTIYPDTISKVSQVFRSSPDLTAVFGSYDDQPFESNFLSQYRNLLHHYVHQIAHEEASTFFAACGAIRRDVFLKIGGFNEKKFRRPSIEDIELGYRLKKAGYTIRLCKYLYIKHLKHWGVFSMIKTDFCQRALPWTSLILKDKMLINDLNTDSASRLSVILTFGMAASLLGSFWWYEFLFVLFLLGAGLLRLNNSFYRFLYRKRGFMFVLKAILWHWLYFFYGGAAFALGALMYWCSNMLYLKNMR